MLTDSQIKEVINHLEKAQNPVFFFDNDVDGLASFLLLRRFINRGKGAAIKSFPELDKSYFRKVHELNADYVFVLDKPKIDGGFLEEAVKANIPVVWIDHHDINMDVKEAGENIYDVLEKRYENLHVYNPTRNKKGSEQPTSYLAYKIANRKEDIWIAMMGCIADGFMPEFAGDFKKQYPELFGDARIAFQALYETELGKITRMLGFALKDRTSNVMKTLRFLISAKSPNDLMEENKNTMHIIKRYEQIGKKYRELVDRAGQIASSSRLLYFQYGGDFSLSADIANELFYKFPGKVIVVAYIKGINANISLRGNIDIRKLTLNAIKDIENATGGGHEHACGAKILVEELPKFRENLERAIK